MPDAARTRVRFVALAAATLQACTGPPIPGCPDLVDVTVGSVPEIRIVMLYSQRAAAASSDIEADIDLAMEETNTAFRRSGISLRLVLAHMEQVNVADNVLGVIALRDALTNGTGSLSVAHTLRNTHHADVVGLTAEVAGGAAWTMLAPGLSYRDKAFLVVGRVGMGAELLLPHELGHVLGGAHQRPVLAPDQPRYQYAYPHVCYGCVVGGITGWRTVMATPTLSYTTRVEYFSNPDVLYGGSATGLPNGALTPEDNGKTFGHSGALVAFYRMTPVWFATSGAVGPWFEKRSADEQLGDIAFADLDGDRETDAFMVQPDGTWRISRSASEPWQVLNDDPSATPLADLRLADVDGDGAADVFRIDATGKWMVSRRGAGAWEVLNSSAITPGLTVDDLAFGRFDGDMTVDIFRSDASSGTWYVSLAGQTAWQTLNGPDAQFKQATAELALGDFDGDGTTDVFRSNVSSQEWFWSRGAAGNWTLLNGPSPELAVPVDELILGDFNGDGTTDVLKANGTAWHISWKGAGPLETVRLSCVKSGVLAQGDFDGDGSTDLLRAGLRP